MNSFFSSKKCPRKTPATVYNITRQAITRRSSPVRSLARIRRLSSPRVRPPKNRFLLRSFSIPAWPPHWHVLQTSAVLGRLYRRRGKCVSSLSPLRLSSTSPGITGLATALRLRQSGHRVTVVDKGTGPREVCVFHPPSFPVPLTCA